MLFVGTQTNDQNKRIEIDFDGLLHHTLIVGQSGGGKSFLVARIIEEILLRSKARILVIDPNGDFRQICTPSESVWEDHEGKFSRLHDLTVDSGIESYDNRENFEEGWAKRRFSYLSPTPGLILKRDDDRVVVRKLVAHWDTLEDDQRNFLLDANASSDPKVFLGLKAVTQNAKWLRQTRPGTRFGFDLRSLQESAMQFAERNIGMHEYQYAKLLDRSDWHSVHAKIDDLLSRYSIWSSTDDGSSPRPFGIADFIDGPFFAGPEAANYWDTLTLSLDAARPADTLLAVDVALSRLWLRAKNAWRDQAVKSKVDASDEDDRVPTFIVIDEAHNFAPDRSVDPLKDRVTARLMQIASEGRKYGLYLILATQRPTKLHRELVPECENACVLRLQSLIETEFASKVLGLSKNEASGVPYFTKGQGVFFGRWVVGSSEINTMIAPARIVVGGGGLSSNWKETPTRTADIATIDRRIATYVKNLLCESDSPVDFATLALEIRTEFGEKVTEGLFGVGSLKKFIVGLGIEQLETSNVPPGYVYLADIHTPPLLVESYTDKLDPETQDAIALLRRHTKIPIIRSDAFKCLIETISEEVQINEFNLTETPKAVRDKCALSEFNIGRTVAARVLMSISHSGHKFDPDLPQSPEVLAEAFTKAVIFGLRKAGVEVDDRTTSALKDYLSGGLLSPKPSSV